VALLVLGSVQPLRAQPPVGLPTPVAGGTQPAAEFPPELVDFVPRPGPPLLAATGANTWDRKIRERGFVFREGGLWHLYYTGYNEARSDARYLGYATSPDGLVWTRWPGNPLTTTGWVEDVDIVKDGNTYYMFSEGRNDIAHMLISKDRIHWQEQGNLDIHYVDGRPLSPGPYGTPTAWRENGRWYLFYERRDEGVWLATSKDLKTWTNVQDDPVLARGPGRYDHYLLALDQVIKYRGRYYGYYHGLAEKGSKNWTTCVAMSPDLIHWKKYAKNPIVDGDKSSSIVIHDGTQFRLYTMHPDVRVYFPRTTPANEGSR
jgi:sucrose-6-phosphate hydrolase SacC (GH32 family)